MSDQGPMISNDRELWREREGDYYANSIHVTDAGGIGINVGGYVIVKPLAGWHKLAAPNGPPRLLTDGADGSSNKGQDTHNPTPEGQGGGEREEALDAARRIVEADDALSNARPGVDYRECSVVWRLACAEGGTLVARALLSSPRVERREATDAELDELAEIIDENVGEFPGDMERAIWNYVARALSLQVG